MLSYWGDWLPWCAIADFLWGVNTTLTLRKDSSSNVTNDYEL